MISLPSTVNNTLKVLVSQYAHNEMKKEQVVIELETLCQTFGKASIYACFDSYYADFIWNGGKFSDGEIKNAEKICTCGAAFTSMPKFHYDWCDLNNKGELSHE